jgi:predicted RNA-binding Zn-ribbon protein involved in translation (DUF1610 family)
MQIGFICPDGKTTTHKECLEKCRMGRRCLSKPTLRKMADVRKFERWYVCPKCGKIEKIE